MSTNAKATQEFVPIKEVRDGIAILKDSSLRAVLLVSSVNFALKSEDEKNALIFQFQDVLNSLDFSIQIVVQSRKLDIRPYVTLLEEREKAQVNELMKIQTREYIEFIKNFTENTNIMTKSFFVVIPYTPAAFQSSSKKSGFDLGSILKRKPKEGEAAKKNEDGAFEENRTQLEQRVSAIEQGLVRTGVRIARLGTEEIIELFYKVFNPGDNDKPMNTTETR